MAVGLVNKVTVEAKLFSWSHVLLVGWEFLKSQKFHKR